MKKVLLMAAFAAATVAVSAQSATPATSTKKAVTFGAKAGVNLSNYKVDLDTEDEASDMRIAYHAGLFASIPVSAMFSVNPGLVYSAEGGKQDLGSETKAVTKLNYLNIPVMVQYNDPSGFFVELGPQIGILTGAKLKTETDGDNEVEIDVKDFFESTNISGSLGLGFKHASGIGFGARYNYGLSNVAKSDDDDDKTKLSTIQIGLIFTFGGK